ncbi:NAD(P)-dependent alcohol dehydrogenase [Arthrobacter sp. MPF02]|uniref:NAD(P)-dependent alcohol dehydrogenase n=1 Tax=Arthrobacter sp. MPF02 TaxID=3388492 RepID=UPI003984F75E
MKAATYRQYGSPDVVSVEEIAKPPVAPHDVLVKVHASTVSAADFRARSRIVPRGLAIPTALSLGILRPRNNVLGMDAAGVVEAVGSDVTAFAPGDEVVAMLGARFGGHAEYVTVPQDAPVTAKPRNMGFEEAVTLPFGGLPALAALKQAGIKPGDRVLINGASGAVGTAAVQLAKHLGAQVTGVCSSRNADLVRSLGADRVIDYGTTDFTAEKQEYDVVMDCVGNAPFARVQHLIKRGGALLLVVADLKSALLAPVQARRSGKKVVVVNAHHAAADLAYLVALAEEGHYRAVIERTYAFSDIVDAHRAADSGHKKGNIVLLVAPAG